MTERTIKDRLDNWGRCQRGGSGGGVMSAKETRSGSGSGGGCMTDVICTMMRQAANGRAGSAGIRSDADHADAELINRAWLSMRADPKALLKWYYVHNKNPSEICRRLEIKHYPRKIFENALGAAEDAIEGMIRIMGAR